MDSFGWALKCGDTNIGPYPNPLLGKLIIPAWVLKSTMPQQLRSASVSKWASCDEVSMRWRVRQNPVSETICRRLKTSLQWIEKS